MLVLLVLVLLLLLLLLWRSVTMLGYLQATRLGQDVRDNPLQDDLAIASVTSDVTV